MGRSTPVAFPVIKNGLNYGTLGVASVSKGCVSHSTSSRSQSHTPCLGDHIASPPPTTMLSLFDEYPLAEKQSGGLVQQMTISQILDQLTEQPGINISDRLIVPEYQDLPFASGSFGDIYRGSLLDGQQVAVQCLRPIIKQTNEGRQTLKRVSEELSIWFGCKHPNVLQLLGIAQHRKQLAIVSPWMPNGTLRSLLSSNLPSKHDLHNFCCQITEGVAYLHETGIVHGDLKTDNILVSTDQRIVLADFGHSIIKEHSSYATSSTKLTNLSLRWMAPELLEGQGTPTTEGDIYSLGMTILEVVTGFNPYAGLDTVEALQNILSRKLPERPERHFPGGDRHADLLWALLHECWDYNPQRRPVAMEVRIKLRNLEAKPIG
ncbi:unnamed protein product [Rhizoctonia solani]|uniref:Protein kinase domain-containing protein n=1 Tax=Rhizoctonia solani TaxID=456999 RepID=A0A8H3C821_9AGAM|nr:unnamed protein product [Rhizoctonia solani]CAE6474093.1 unnamed protein product [Rhizoctonia solani]